MTTTKLTHDELDAFRQLAEEPLGVDVLVRIFVGNLEGLIDQDALVAAIARGGYWGGVAHLLVTAPEVRVEAWRASHAA